MFLPETRSIVRGAVPFLALMILPIAAWMLVPGLATRGPVLRSSAGAPAPPANSPATPARSAAVDGRLTAAGGRRPVGAATVSARQGATTSEAAPTGRAASVRGRVLDPEGRPVEGAKVVCRDAGGAAAPVETDDRGEFAFEPGIESCTLSAQAPPHAGSDPTSATAGVAVELRLRAPGSIAGRVLLRDGSPSTSYDLWITCHEPPCAMAPIHHVEDPAGAFEIDGLAPGTYDLVVRRPGLAASDATTVEVDAGARVEPVTLRVPD